MTLLRRVIVADDNRTNQMVLAKILEKGGFDSVVVASGEAVLDALWVEQPVDAAVLDVGMPGVGGIEAIQLIRFAEAGALPSERLPIVSVSADDRWRTRRDCLDAGADTFIVQPVNPPVLLGTLRQLIAEREAAASQRSKIVLFPIASDRDAYVAGDIIDSLLVDQLYALGGSPYLAELAQAIKTDTDAAFGHMTAAIDRIHVEDFRQEAFNISSVTVNIGCGRVRAILECALGYTRIQLKILGPGVLLRLRAEIDAVCDVLLSYSGASTALAPVVGG